MSAVNEVNGVSGVGSATEQKLMTALMQFKRLGWHPHAVAGCNPGELRVLFCIKKNTGPQVPEMKVSEISKRLHVTSPTVTQLLNKLEAHGLIERRIDPEDRRAVGVKLTRAGESITEEAIATFTSSMQGLVEYLGEEQSNQLADLLSTVFRYFSEKEAREANAFHASWNGDEV